MAGSLRKHRVRRLTPAQWIDRLLACRGTKTTGIARRLRSNIPAYMTTDVMRDELRKRSFTLIVSGENYIAISHEHPIAIFR